MYNERLKTGQKQNDILLRDFEEGTREVRKNDYWTKHHRKICNDYGNERHGMRVAWGACGCLHGNNLCL